jgi:hypothetical protein
MTTVVCGGLFFMPCKVLLPQLKLAGKAQAKIKNNKA